MHSLKKHGEDKAEAVVLDSQSWIKSLKCRGCHEAYPDLDSVFLNSGNQRGFDFTKPEMVNLEALGEELNTKYLSYIHLTVAFLPSLQKKQS